MIGHIRLSVSTTNHTYELSKWPAWHSFARIDFIRLGSVTTNRKNGLIGEQFAVGTESRFVSTGPSRMFTLATKGYHVGYSREFVDTVYCADGQSKLRPLYCGWYHEAAGMVSYSMIRLWMNKYIHVKLWCINTHACPNSSDGFVKPPLKFGRGWVITSHRKQWM